MRKSLFPSTKDLREADQPARRGQTHVHRPAVPCAGPLAGRHAGDERGLGSGRGTPAQPDRSWTCRGHRSRGCGARPGRCRAVSLWYSWSRAAPQLAERARQSRLTFADLEGGVGTLSNLGMYRVDRFEGIISPGQSFILAAGKLRDRPWVEDTSLVDPANGHPESIGRSPRSRRRHGGRLPRTDCRDHRKPLPGSLE